MSAVFCSTSSALDFKGEVSIQGQAFTASSQHAADHKSNASVAADIELYQEFDGSNKSITFRPFIRLDQHDDERSHLDIRELIYLQASDRWEFKVGLGQVFWGVAESRNIVDVINQSDQVEGLTSSDKLGQPLLNFTSINSWGDISVFVLPYFRERSFAGIDGRPRFSIPVDADAPQYESGDKENHLDIAFRYSHYINEWDFGLSYFRGTSRTPQLRPDAQTGSLVPYYFQLSQPGIDVQATLESWLLKLEAIYQSGDQIEDHAEIVTGLEYSFYGVFETALDIGIIAEYLWDQRDQSSNNFQNDILLGLRFAANDEQSTEALIGVIADLDGNGQVFTLEANRRIGNAIKLSAEAVIWEGDDNPLMNEDYLQLQFGYFF